MTFWKGFGRTLWPLATVSLVFACGAFETVRSPADAVIQGAGAHGALCEAYAAACAAETEACDSRADAICAVRCE